MAHPCLGLERVCSVFGSNMACVMYGIALQCFQFHLSVAVAVPLLYTQFPVWAWWERFTSPLPYPVPYTRCTLTFPWWFGVYISCFICFTSGITCHVIRFTSIFNSSQRLQLGFFFFGKYFPGSASAKSMFIS